MDHKSLWENSDSNLHRVIASGIGALLYLSAPSVMASSPLPISTRADLLGGIEKDQPLSSVRLSGIRGKYINGDKIVYFGLCLSSEWQNKLMVGANIDFSIQGNKPTFVISSYSTDGTSGGVWMPNFSGAFPFNNSYGVKQGIQVAGNNNQVTNMVGIQVGSYTGSGSTGNQLPYSNVYYNGSASGGLVVDGNGLISLGVTVPGDGLIGQQIGSGGIAQYAGLKSDANSVMNNLTMQVGTSGVANFIYSTQLNLLLQNMSGIMH